MFIPQLDNVNTIDFNDDLAQYEVFKHCSYKIIKFYWQLIKEKATPFGEKPHLFA